MSNNYSKYLTYFVSDKLSLFDHNNYEEIYSEADDSLYLNTAELTDLILTELQVNPLEYMTWVPNNFATGLKTLTSITIPDCIKYLRSYCFSDSGLLKINIPNSVLEIESRSFLGCLDLQSITLSNNISIIPRECFGKCKSLTSIDIPSSVKVLDYNAFYGCTNLSKVILHEGLESIYSRVFIGCPNLTEIILPKSVISFDTSSIPHTYVYKDSMAHKFALKNNIKVEVI